MKEQDLQKKVVLVTGAGGSIGSELCREISLYDPSELIMVDRDESGLHGTQLIIENSALLDSPGLVLADLRERNDVEKIFAERRPHVVFHAAALKHLPLLERHPSEAVKTNVWGTLCLLELAPESRWQAGGCGDPCPARAPKWACSNQPDRPSVPRHPKCH